MKERRKLERIYTHLPAQWETRSGTHEGIVVNGSGGGCFLRAQVEEPGDEPIKLMIQLPDGRCIHLWGQVTYHLMTMGFGLQFTHSSDEGQMMFNIWLEYLHTLEEAQMKCIDREVAWNGAKPVVV